MVLIGSTFLLALLSGMLIMTCLGWSIYFFRDDSPLARTSAWFALALAVGYIITSVCKYAGDWMLALSLHIVAVDMLAMPLGALLMVMVMQSSRVTMRRVLWNILPFVLLCPWCLITRHTWYIYTVVGLIAAYITAMIIYIIIKGLSYEQHIRDEYSDLTKQSTLWLVTTLVFVTLVVLNLLVFINGHNTVLELGYTIVAIGAWHLIFGRLMLISRHRASGDSMQIEELMQEPPAKSATPLISEDVESFTKTLTHLMDEEHIFLKPDLTRDELSRQMGMSHTNFTTLLKQTTGLNFYEYINGQRVKYAAQLIDSGKTDITSISNRSGFRYRSTFYRAFAAMQHCTPAEYIGQKNK